jgi:hypothetical protein
VRLAGVLLVAACGAKAPAESLENLEHRSPQPTRTLNVQVIRAARPDIDITWALPDFHDDLRWPLTGMNHPVLEPRYAVAQQLAMPGIGWEELCARGVHNRVSATQKEMLAYLRGWCEVRKGNVDGACAQLRPLFGSVTPGLTAALRQDLANILVDQGGDRAEHWLSKHDIRDIQTLDLLAANFVELGSSHEAFTINRRAIDSDSYASAATQCRRLVRRIKLEQEVSWRPAIDELKTLGRQAKVPDPVCERLYNKVECSLAPASDCLRFLTDEGLPESALYLLDAYFNWPYEGTVAQWFAAATIAAKALPSPGAAELAIRALEAAVPRGLTCKSETVHTVIAAVRADPTNAIYEERLQRLEKSCPKAPAKDAAPSLNPPPTRSPTAPPPP